MLRQTHRSHLQTTFPKEAIDTILAHPILRKIARSTYDRLGSLLYRIFWIFPIDPKKIVYCNYNGDGYGDNPKYISEEVIKRGLNYKQVWLILSENIPTSEFPETISTVPWYSLSAMYELATAGIWIDNNRKEGYVRKRKGQIYIQTWHGGFALKKVEADVFPQQEWYVRNAKNDSKMADIFVSGSKIQSQIYRNSFWYEGDILEVGYPRNDILLPSKSSLKNKKILLQKIFKGMQRPTNKKILLYAPTFRKKTSQKQERLDFQKCINALMNRFGGEWIVLVRLHPTGSKNHNIGSDEIQGIYDLSAYPDMQELLYISDVLITDYSSCMFDFGLTMRPCFLYTPDLNSYMNDDRGFYIELDELPFSVFRSNEELCTGIESHDTKTYIENINYFFEKYGSFERGNASQSVVNWIVEHTPSLQQK